MSAARGLLLIALRGLTLTAAEQAECRSSLAADSSAGPVVGPLVPRRVAVNESGWQAALDALWQDGAVVLAGLGLEDVPAGEVSGDFRSAAGKLPSRLFTGAAPSVPRLLTPDAPVNGVHEELREAEKRGLNVPGGGLEPHTDGYVYGDDLPDFVFLLCEKPSTLGGANVLLDGEALLRGLRMGSVAEKQLAVWLSTTSVDLSENAETGIVQGRAAEGPVVQWLTTAGGRERLKWRRQTNIHRLKRLEISRPLSAAAGVEDASNNSSLAGCLDTSAESYLSLWQPLAGTEAAMAAEVQAQLQQLDAVVRRASAAAFAQHGFFLASGEALVVDNYRVLHGRARYLQPSEGASTGAAGEGAEGAGPAIQEERKLWRVWAWTSEGSGIPPDGARTSNPLNDDVFERHQASAGKAEL